MTKQPAFVRASKPDQLAAADALFAKLQPRFLALPGVRPGTGFGSNLGLRLEGKIFAMAVRGALVVKLPRDRVDALAAAKKGTPFVVGGRAMKEWIAVSLAAKRDWPKLVDEAHRFAQG